MSQSGQFEQSENQSARLTLADRIRQIQGSLSPAEHKLSRVFLANYPTAGLESTVEFAKKGNVSAPHRAQVRQQTGLQQVPGLPGCPPRRSAGAEGIPADPSSKIRADSDAPELARSVAETAVEGIESTVTSLPEHEFDRAVALLCNTSLQITSIGGRFSHLLATYLDLHLRLMRPNTLVHAQHPNNDSTFIADLSKRDVCVFFDFRRYQKDTVDLAKAARGERGQDHPHYRPVALTGFI